MTRDAASFQRNLRRLIERFEDEVHESDIELILQSEAQRVREERDNICGDCEQ